MKVRLNENEEIVRTVKEGLARTGGYCPCRGSKVYVLRVSRADKGS